MLPTFDYAKATTLDHALEMLANPDTKVLAGGTDLIVDMRETKRAAGLLVDVSEVSELSAVRADADAVHLGGCATMTTIERDATIRREFPVLVDAVRSFADFLIRNKATIGGNLANASPGADLTVPLLALDASVVLAKRGAERTMPLDEFLVGPRQTRLEPGELISEIVIPTGAPRGGAYEKLGLKHGGAIAVVSSTVLMDVAGGVCSHVRIALGAVAPRPYRSTDAERTLEGRPYSDDLADEAARLAAESARPISDVRGSAEYRTAMVRALVRRGIANARRAAED